MDNKDCLGCRIVSGSGLIGAAAYIAHQSKKSVNKWGRLFMQFTSFGFASVGAARLLNIYPFNVTHKNLKLGENKKEVNSEKC